MIATLSMYDWAGQSDHWDIFWKHLRDALRARQVAAPDSLTRGGSLWDHWQSPALCLGQTCGMPYRTRLHGKVTLLGALDHALSGAPPGHYYSNLVVHRNAVGTLPDFAGKTLAYNGLDSESGWAAAQNEAALHGFCFTRKLHTGAHRDSALAVAEGRADIAAFDAETWRLVETYLPEISSELRILQPTRPTPGLPLIAARNADAEAILAAVDDALATTPKSTLTALHVNGFVRIPSAAYLAVPVPVIPSQDIPAV